MAAGCGSIRPKQPVIGGMSGSPIVLPDGAAPLAWCCGEREWS